MFVDLVASMRLTEGWDAEDVRELLSGYYAVARTVVERHGGVVEKFIGDAVVAVWGSRSSRDDDAAQCVRSGLEIMDAVVGFGTASGLVGMVARGGIVTGHLAARASVDEGLVAGDRVNLAARIQAAAEPGTVLVDEVTMRATRSMMAYSEAGEHLLKGVAEPLPLWRAVRVAAAGEGANHLDALEGAFVGRSRELATVKELFHSTAEGSRARLVAVSGVAGIGKTRLSLEFERYVDGLVGEVFWHRGRCLPYGDGVAFWALAEMVRQRFAIADDDTAEVAAAKLAEGLPQWVPDAAERAFIEPRLGVLLAAVDREMSQEELFAGWRLFLERLAAVRPVVLVVEDLHWADAGLLEFIEYLLDWSGALPIYVLTLARPEAAERRHGWLAGRRNTTDLHLEPLADSAIRQLLDDLVPGMPERVKGKITAHAGGVPLYAVETIRTLMDKDLVVARNGMRHLEGDVGDLAVPASLTALIAERLDGLPADERELIKGLAVLGETFLRRAVPAVSDASDDLIDEWLRTLVRKEVLLVHPEPLAPDRDQYAFVQAMLRSVAHDTLTRRERKLRHQGVADYLRAAAPDQGADVTEMVADHLLQAYRAAGTDPDADALRAETMTAFERAGERAAAVGAPETARTYYQTAAELTKDEVDHTRLTTRTAWMAERAGHPADALALLEAAAAAHREAGREVAAARLVASSGWMRLNYAGQPDLTMKQLDQARLVLERNDDQQDLPGLYAMLGAALSSTDRAAAAEHLERGLVLATALEQDDDLLSGLHSKATLLMVEHRVVEAMALFSAAAEFSHRHDDLEMEARARGSLGDLLCQADLPEAAAQLEAAMGLSNRLGDALFQAEAAIRLGVLHFYLGEWAKTEQYAVHAVEISQRAGLPDGLLFLVLLHAARGDLDGAEQHLATLESSTDPADPDRCATLDLARGLVAFARGDADAAMTAATKVTHEIFRGYGLFSPEFRLAWPLAVEAAMAAGRVDEAQALMSVVAGAPTGHVSPYLRAQLARLGALVAVALGENTTAEDQLRSAQGLFRELGYPYWVARTQVDLARWLIEHERADEIEPLLAEATELFTRLGAHPDLEQLAALEQVHPPAT